MEEQIDSFEKEVEIDKSLFPISTDGVNSSSLLRQGNELTSKIIEENDPAKLDELTQLFTLNQKKKQIARTNKLSNLLELVDDEVISRFTNTPEAIEDKDLLSYLRVTQDYVNSPSEPELPHIQINNQTNVNISSSGLDRESRARVLDAVNEILKSSLQKIPEDDIIDLEEIDSD